MTSIYQNVGDFRRSSVRRRQRGTEVGCAAIWLCLPAIVKNGNQIMGKNWLPNMDIHTISLSSHREEAAGVDGPASLQAEEHGRGEAGDLRPEGLLLR